MFRQLKTFAVAAMASIVLGAGSAGAVSIGNDAIDRGSFDSYSNFGVALTGVVSPTSGTINSYDVFASAGTFALLVLRPTATSTEFTLIDYDQETAVNGAQTFSASLAIQSGDVLGLFMGTGKISFELDSTPNNCGTPNCDVFFTANNGLPSLAGLVGTTIAFDAGATDRTYSVKASVVPLPAGLPLALSGLAGFWVVRRRRKAQA